MKINISLHLLREAADLTQVQLAKRMKITQPQISRIEASKNLTIETLLSYAKAAGAEQVNFIAFKGDRSISLGSLKL